MGYNVRDVNFNQEKEAAVAAWNIYNETDALMVPVEFDLFATQVRGWKRNKIGKIDKRNDHLCDAAVCYFSKFIDRMGLSYMRALPVVFSAGGVPSSSSQQNDQLKRTSAFGPGDYRAAAVRGFGGGRR
jgi:hypothetical protein